MKPDNQVNTKNINRKKSEVLDKKLELLKIEITILNDRINHIVGYLWKVRQISLTLWLASLGVGFGALSNDNKHNLNILILSTLVPLLFSYMDARLTRWYFRFKMRDAQIQSFLSQSEYVLPSTQIKMSFAKSLENQNLIFPVYDLTGIQTFGDDNYYRWNTKVVRAFIAATPLAFYGLQILVSVLFICFEYNKITDFKLWWAPPAFVLLLIIILYLIDKSKIRKLSPSKAR